MNTINFELCTDSLEGALIATKYGLKRIELCSALSVGGLTPSFGLISECVNNTSVEVHVMIRHKEGGFIYSLNDLEIMKADIIEVNKAGAKGVVFGILNEKYEVSAFNKELVDLSKSLKLEVTFHRAFDVVTDFKKAIEQLINYGFDRLLTSGLQLTAEEGLDVISYLQSNYGHQIQIMAGSGINSLNALKIASSGINNIHFTARKPLISKDNFSMGEDYQMDEEKIKAIISQF